MTETLTVFDWIALALLLASGLLALTRGFIREILSVTAFIAAAFAALWMFPIAQEPARSFIQPAWAADIVAVAAVFLVIYIAVSLVTSSLSKSLRGGGEPGLLDRLAGFIFGVARGVIVLALFVILINAMSPPDETPPWLRDAQLYPLLNSTAEALQDFAPEGSTVAEGRLGDDTADEEMQPAPDTSLDERGANDDIPVPDEEPAYEQRQRRSLDQLITTQQDDGDEEQP